MKTISDEALVAGMKNHTKKVKAAEELQGEAIYQKLEVRALIACRL